MSWYASILSSLVSKDILNWFMTRLESINNYVFMAPILNGVLSAKIVASYFASLFKAKNLNLIAFSLSCWWVG